MVNVASTKPSERDRVGEIRICAYRIEKKKLVAAEGTLIIRSRDTADFLERRNPHQIR